MADEAERVARENRATEEKGIAWQERSDEFLVGYVSEQNRPGQFHTPAIVEMQRRAMVATQEFNEQSSVQTAQAIRLTRQLKWLTIVIGGIAAVQLIVMIVGLVQRGA